MPDRKRLADEYRKNAGECEAAGYHVIAEVNRELADLMDPPPVAPRKDSKVRGERELDGEGPEYGVPAPVVAMMKEARDRLGPRKAMLRLPVSHRRRAA